MDNLNLEITETADLEGVESPKVADLYVQIANVYIDYFRGPMLEETEENLGTAKGIYH